MASTEAELEEYKGWMEPVTHVYSKGMATPQEGAISKVRTSFVTLRNARELVACVSITNNTGFGCFTAYPKPSSVSRRREGEVVRQRCNSYVDPYPS